MWILLKCEWNYWLKWSEVNSDTVISAYFDGFAAEFNTFFKHNNDPVQIVPQFLVLFLHYQHWYADWSADWVNTSPTLVSLTLNQLFP